jgi:hypothetical protein
MNLDALTLAMMSTGLPFNVSKDENDCSHALSITYPEIVFFPFCFEATTKAWIFSNDEFRSVKSTSLTQFVAKISHILSPSIWRDTINSPQTQASHT